MNKEKKREKFCGECCWFYAEDTYGYGCCPYRFAEVKQCDEKCDVPVKYVNKRDMRHYMAVLTQLNRCRRDLHDPAIYKKPLPVEIGKAIDFAIRYIKIFSNL